jgi:hypothetical protein
MSRSREGREEGGERMVHLHAGVPAPVVAILTIALAHTVLAVMESPGRSCAWRRPCYNLAPPGADFVTHPRYTQPKRRRLRFTEEQRGAATCATPTGGWPAWLLTPPWLPAPRRARPSSMAPATSSSDHDPTEVSRLRSARPGPSSTAAASSSSSHDPSRGVEFVADGKSFRLGGRPRHRGYVRRRALEVSPRPLLDPAGGRRPACPRRAEARSQAVRPCGRCSGR